MKYDKNRVTVNIYGQQYTIVGVESTTHIHTVTDDVHQEMNRIKQSYPDLDPTKIAVLSAVNICNEKHALYKRINEIEQEKQGLYKIIKELEDVIANWGNRE